MATSADGTRIAWYAYDSGEPTVLFLPTWNLVDARVVGHQVAAFEAHATVVTYDPRGAGASNRPERGYDFPFHAADALAVLDATGIGNVALVTASRGLNAALLLIADDPERFERLAVVAPFMHDVFTEPDSSEVIAEMIAIGLEATPEVVVAGEREIDWKRPARLLGTIAARRSSSTAKPT
jgi:pimeloyl-ACP methyl ester carboxylesterase